MAVPSGDREEWLVAEIKRVDEVASTVFEVCVAVAGAGVAVLFAVDDAAVRIGAAVVALVEIFMAVEVVPDAVFGQREPDLGTASLERYLKMRRRKVQGAILVLAALALIGLDIAMGVGIADVADEAAAGVVAGVCGFGGGLVAVLSDRAEFWPPEIRGKPQPPDS